jgi:hypothetical protein
VGHTINFVQRKISHEQNSKSDKCKLYQIIRTNGGWCNWTMEIIAFFNCMNHTEARMKEQEYFLSLNANLNSVEPFPKKEKKEKKVKEEEKDVKVKEVKEEEKEIVIDSTASKYSCKLCDYKTLRCSQYDRHLRTTKHKKLQNSENINQLFNDTKYICKTCDREYKDRSGLWKHNKTCNTTTQTIIKPNIDISEIVNENKDKIIEILVKENMEYKNIFSIFIKEILSKKSIEEFLKKK